MKNRLTDAQRAAVECMRLAGPLCDQRAGVEKPFYQGLGGHCHAPSPAEVHGWATPDGEIHDYPNMRVSVKRAGKMKYDTCRGQT